MSKKTRLLNVLLTIYGLTAFAYISFEFANFNMSNFGNFVLYTLFGFYCLVKNGISKKTDIANDILVWIMSAAFSATVVLGYHFTYETVITAKVLIMFVFSIGGLTSVYKAMFTQLYELLKKWAVNEVKGCWTYNRQEKTKLWIKAFAIIMICWTVVWLAYYPGFINYDHEQIQQVLNSEYTTHHPIIHTLLFGGLYKIGLETGNAVTGIIIYDFLQMSIMADIFAYSYVYIKNHISSKIFCAVVLAFFAVFPLNSILAISTTKDVIFSGLVLLSLILLLEYIEEKRKGKCFAAVLMLATVGMLLFRNNAFYAFVLMLFVAVCFVRLQRKSKNIIIFMLVAIVAYKGADAALVRAFNAKQGSIGEMLSVPTQQFGRVYYTAEELGDEGTMQLVENFYDMDKAIYRQHISDMMKKYIKNVDSSENLIEYFKTSLELFKRYPLVTVQSVVYLTQGHWDINDLSHAEIYGTDENDRFGYLSTRVYEGYGVETNSKIPVLEELMENGFTKNKYQYIPAISLLFAPAFYLWFLALYTIQMIKAKRWTNLFIGSFFWFYILTLLAGPCSIIRYTYPLIISVPVLITTMIKTISDEKTEKNNG